MLIIDAIRELNLAIFESDCRQSLALLRLARKTSA
jgi:hypothetical protein